MNSFVSPVSIGRFADLKADASIVPADLNPAELSTAFNAMDRTVHRRPGYAFALARNSSRISKYEYMSGENLLPWFQGDGAHYLYLSGQDQTQAKAQSVEADAARLRTDAQRARAERDAAKAELERARPLPHSPPLSIAPRPMAFQNRRSGPSWRLRAGSALAVVAVLLILLQLVFGLF